MTLYFILKEIYRFTTLRQSITAILLHLVATVMSDGFGLSGAPGRSRTYGVSNVPDLQSGDIAN